MKLRTFLLVGCMLVVPAWAMFSHVVPAELRQAFRDLVAPAQPAAGAPPVAASTLVTTPNAQAVVPAVTAGTTTLQGATSLPADPVAGSPKADGATPAADAVAPQQPPAMVSQLADRTRQVRDQQARELQAIEAQLTHVGAIGFDCQPLAGGEGLHGCSCRVPVDASGQLQRVFQAAGHDPLTAATALRDQVTAWKDRAGRGTTPAQDPQAQAPAAGSLPAAMAPGVGAAVMPYAGDRLR
jgi:hypothetical protein